ncbi:MAG: hypothetical protein EHM58_09215 [Ignavibacteriae bacterium]|nr:MAG: hypothetical protein EHM58_09215 [Ignavibacteriota bacterium]
MKKNIINITSINTKVFLVLISFAVLMITDSCNWFTSWDDSYDFTIKIDSFAVTKEWVNRTDTLQVAFWGTVGNTECHSFKGFTKSITQDSAFISAAGHKSAKYREICSNADIKITGEICSIFPVSEGTFTIIVKQPDGSALEKQIWIH